MYYKPMHWSLINRLIRWTKPEPDVLEAKMVHFIFLQQKSCQFRGSGTGSIEFHYLGLMGN